MTRQDASRLDPKSLAILASALARISICMFLLSCALLAACTTTDVRTASDASGAPLRVQGSVVLIEPDIELYEVMTGGMQEPRPAWTEAARRAYPAAVREVLAAHGATLMPDFVPPPALPPTDRMRQLLLLNQAVASSIVLHSGPDADLATKHGRFDWTLGPGVSVLREATGADYALFTYIRDSYTGQGRAAMRVVGALLLAGDIGGGEQVGLASLVDLRTGQVVWFNLLHDENGDLRNADGARATVASLLKQVPL
ncbi:MAG TPA: hypothetical protein VK660_05425 [Xanthomonadaceae bacterium]|nr:hypothetical protein [Xanthomonadaceae bacterium]